MAGSELFIEYTEEKIEARRGPTMTANTSGQTCVRPTPEQFGLTLVNELQNEINKQNIFMFRWMERAVDILGEGGDHAI